MSKVFVEDTEMRDIADAIREKNGTENTYKPSEMPQAIKDIESGGSWYDTFWDNFQQNGERTDYSNTFNQYWNESNFKPKYDIKPTSCQNMFNGFLAEVDLREVLNECGITLDFSNVTIGNYAFSRSKLTALPALNCPNGYLYWFFQCSLLHTIDKIVFNKEMSPTQLNAFDGCSALQNIVIEGEIGDNISFKKSPFLTMDSINSIINALFDYSGTDTSPTIQLHSTVKGNLTDDQIATITNKNWTLA